MKNCASTLKNIKRDLKKEAPPRPPQPSRPSERKKATPSSKSKQYVKNTSPSPDRSHDQIYHSQYSKNLRESPTSLVNSAHKRSTMSGNHSRRESRNLTLNRSFEAENKTPNGLSYSSQNYPSSTRASSRQQSTKRPSKTKNNQKSIREYLMKLAKKNLLRLGEKLEGVSMAVVQQRIAQEFEQVERKVVERIGLLLKSLTAAVKRELLNFINLKIKLAMAKSGIIPEGKKDLLVTAKDLTNFKLPEFACPPTVLVQVKNTPTAQTPRSRSRGSSTTLLSSPKGALAFSATDIFPQDDENKHFRLTGIEKQNLERAKRDVFSKIGIAMSDLSSKLLGRIDQNLKSSTQDTTALLMSHLDSELRRYLGDIAAELQRRVDETVKVTVSRAVSAQFLPQEKLAPQYVPTHPFKPTNTEQEEELRVTKKEVEDELMKLEREYRQREQRFLSEKEARRNSRGRASRESSVSRTSRSEERNRMPSSRTEGSHSARNKKHNFQPTLNPASIVKNVSGEVIRTTMPPLQKPNEARKRENYFQRLSKVAAESSVAESSSTMPLDLDDFQLVNESLMTEQDKLSSVAIPQDIQMAWSTRSEDFKGATPAPIIEEEDETPSPDDFKRNYSSAVVRRSSSKPSTFKTESSGRREDTKREERDQTPQLDVFDQDEYEQTSQRLNFENVKVECSPRINKQTELALVEEESGQEASLNSDEEKLTQYEELRERLHKKLAQHRESQDQS